MLSRKAQKHTLEHQQERVAEKPCRKCKKLKKHLAKVQPDAPSKISSARFLMRKVAKAGLPLPEGHKKDKGLAPVLRKLFSIEKDRASSQHEEAVVVITVNTCGALKPAATRLAGAGKVAKSTFEEATKPCSKVKARVGKAFKGFASVFAGCFSQPLAS